MWQIGASWNMATIVKRTSYLLVSRGEGGASKATGELPLTIKCCSSWSFRFLAWYVSSWVWTTGADLSKLFNTVLSGKVPPKKIVFKPWVMAHTVRWRMQWDFQGIMLHHRHNAHQQKLLISIISGVCSCCVDALFVVLGGAQWV